MEEGTRICVKNLPKIFNDAQLKDNFDKYGEITDCKIMHTK